VTAILTHTVKMLDGFPPGTGVITINDDNTFVLTKVDPSTNQAIRTDISTPMSQLAVRGRGTFVRFRTASVTKNVDFSLSSELIRNDFGIAGEIAGGVMANKSGVGEVMAALRKGGAQVKYLTYVQRILRNWLIAICFIVVIVGVIALAALAQR
jgi:hypothetical protein